MAGIREQKKMNTRNAILDAAIRLFAERGFEQTSMEELAREAGIGKATIYGYFSTKNEIFLAYCEEEVEFAFSLLSKKQDEDAPLSDQLLALMMGQLTYVTGNREFGRVFSREMYFPGKKDVLASRDLDMKYLERLMDVLVKGQGRGELPKKCDLILLMGHLHALYLLTVSLFYQGDVKSLDEAETLLQALVRQTLNGPAAPVHINDEEEQKWELQKRMYLQRRNLEL